MKISPRSPKSSFLPHDPMVFLCKCGQTPPTGSGDRVQTRLIIPPTKQSFRKVYCVQHVRDSVIPKFRQHLMILLYNFDSFCPILFKFTYPPQNGVLGGVYCFQHVRDSVIPKFCQHLMILLYNFETAFVRFCSNLHHTITIRQCMFDRKIGAEGSVLQELCHFVILTIRCLCYD